MLWACRNLASFPDPTKSVEDQETKLLEILMLVEEEIEKEAERQRRERQE